MAKIAIHDKVNPFEDLNSCHLTWPTILLNYNLSPWLMIKCYFSMLALLILDKESMTSTNVDVYLVFFFEELQVLWVGVKAYDAYKGHHST
jgi:hypothetical protein